MKTTADLIKEVDAELNAVKAADMGLEALQAFAMEAQNQFSVGDMIKTKDALDNLASLVTALRTAVPANVIPASAGPVGKTPKEQFLDQAYDEAKAHLARLSEMTSKVQELVQTIGQAAEATNLIKLTTEVGIESQKAA